MNLETIVDTRIWSAIQNHIEARNYKSAVLDAIHALTDVIRERSGEEGDGVALVHAAFGGASPKLKVNKLQTESEQNVQRGTEAMMRGLYQAIRNPRSHEQHQDTEADARAIILFIDYLLRVVDQSRSPFQLSEFLSRVLDPDFVPSQRYATLLVGEIPPGKRLAVCREVFKSRGDANAQKLRPFFNVILGEMPPAEVAELAEIVSDEFRQNSQFDTIVFVIQAFPPSFWAQLSEVARLRIENKLINAVRVGAYSRETQKCLDGSLGTWANGILDQFTLRKELWDAVFSRVNHNDEAGYLYSYKFFLDHTPKHFDSPPAGLSWRINEGLRAGVKEFRFQVNTWKRNRKPDDPWVTTFADELALFQEAATAAPAEPAEPDFQDLPF